MSGRSTALAVLAAVAGLLLVAGCSDEGGDEQDVTIIEDDGSGIVENPDASVPDVEAAAGMPDPCSLVTDDEVASATGTEPTDTARAQLTPTSAACTFRADDDPLVIVTVEIGLDGTIMSADDYEETVEAIDAEEVDGLGDAAFWSPILGSVQAYQGDELVDVTLILSEQDPDDLRQPAVDLATAALGRL